MFRKSLLAAGLIAAGLLGVSSAAEARTNIYLGIGVPYGFPIAPGYGADCFGHGYRYCQPGVRHYRGYPRYYAPRPIYRPRAVYRLSCGQARIMLRNRGWYRISAHDCGGRVYSFTGWHDGRPYLVNVNSGSGRVISRRRL